MIPATTFAGRRVAVFGLGRSGAATYFSLMAAGATVCAWDESEIARQEAQDAGVKLVDLESVNWSTIDSFVLAPGVPLTHPVPHWTVERAKQADVEIIGDIEIFARERAAARDDVPFIAITGTNGKSTTTALITHILKAAGVDVQMGGNIGVPILSLAPPMPGRVYVVEMSSYQIDLTPTLQPSVGILLNVSPDHIDRHGTFANYQAIKARLVEEADRSVVGVDDTAVADIARNLIGHHQHTTAISVSSRLVDGYYLESGRIFRASDGARSAVVDLDGLSTLRGAHSAQNIMAACAALEAIKVPLPNLATSLKTFPGLAHRLEEVGRQERVIFVNDSKATNADSAAVALASFPRDIFWICGGRGKAGGIASLKELLPRVSRAYLIGESEDEFASQLSGEVHMARCGTLEIAVAAAARDAAASDGAEPIVLLAPACASFDQYVSFEARGNHFREIVMALAGIELREDAGP